MGELQDMLELGRWGAWPCTEVFKTNWGNFHIFRKPSAMHKKVGAAGLNYLFHHLFYSFLPFFFPLPKIFWQIK
jgi:hypothetical protein